MRLGIFAALLSVAILAARTAEATGDAAEHLIKQGVELRAKGKDAEALVLFQKAYAATPSPRALAQIALAEQALGRWIEDRIAFLSQSSSLNGLLHK